MKNKTTSLEAIVARVHAEVLLARFVHKLGPMQLLVRVLELDQALMIAAEISDDEAESKVVAGQLLSAVVKKHNRPTSG